MKNHSSFVKIQNYNKNLTIKMGLILYVAIFISIETGKDFIQSSYKIEKIHVEEKQINYEIRSNNPSLNSIITTIESPIFNRAPKLNAGITIYKNIETPQIITIHKNSIYRPVKQTQHTDIHSFIEHTWNLPKVILVTEALNINSEIPDMNPNSNETYLQDMTISQLGNFNVAIQVNVKNIGQVQYIQQIGSNNNNNPYKNNNYIRKSYIDNSLSIITIPIMRINILKNSIDESLSFPVSQYSNQIVGIAVEKVIGDDNNTYQFQESTDQQSLGGNEAYLSLNGNENDVLQGQSGFRNSSKIDIIGNINLVTNSQYGELNYAGIITSGIKNVVNVEQVGFNNLALIFQNGVNNIVNVVQHQY